MKSKIIRTSTKAQGGVTSEELLKMKEHSAEWIKNAFRTEPINKEKITSAIKGLYKVSGLKEPRVVIVPSPRVMVYAAAIASAWWSLQKKNAATGDATDAATRAATYAATYDATDDATYAATDAATGDATDAATRAATYAATRAATDAATRAATDAATYDATRAATRDATYDATHAATDAATDAATRAATHAATRDATDAATYDATDAATYYATYDATHAATRDATDAATYAATDAATYAATYAATDAATYDATGAATRAATRDASTIFKNLSKYFLGNDWKLAVNMVGSWYSAYQGGNMWSYYDCFLSAFRVVLGLALPIYEKYKFWEEAAKEGGFRYMHSEFCLVCDFPEIIKINKTNQPHAEGGPSHRWRDGWSLWHLNGVKVEQWMAETPSDDLDAKKILRIENVDQRREVLRRLGVVNMVKQLGGKVIDKDYTTKSNYELLELDIGIETPCRYLKMNNPSIEAIHVEGVPNDCMTVQEAINWRRYGNKSLEWSPTQLT